MLDAGLVLNHLRYRRDFGYYYIHRAPIAGWRAIGARV